ncbi:MAG TPA: SPOR domain-containing protein [Candidatus Eisenbacteria bacterium]|nr:SPOR domain-containing protein [Candidatus Eisenbacteria bacterium]
MKTALVLILLLVAAPADAWQPPSGGPSKIAKRVLDSLQDPAKVPIPRDVEERSRHDVVQATAPVSQGSTPSPGGCWQVQLTAVSDPDRARDMAAQESSRLGVPVHVAVENGLSKVRAGDDCMTYDQATALRDQVRPGYPGAFVIRSAGPTGS